MDDVLFVRELAADRDLVLAFTADGTPAWAMDLESGVQWWYPGGDNDEVRDAIHESWSGFATMPIAAASYGGPHPAVELARRARRPVAVPERAATPVPVIPRAVAVLGRLPAPVRLAALSLAALACLVALPLVLLLLFGMAGEPASAPSGSAASDQGVHTAGSPCSVLGATARDGDGHALVCVPPSRAFPSVLDWRATS